MQELRGKISNLASGQRPAATQIAKTTVQKPTGPQKKDKSAASKPAVPSGDLTQVSDSAQNIPAVGFSATRVIGPGQAPGVRKDGAAPSRRDGDGRDTTTRKTEAPGATVIAGSSVRQPATPTGVPADPRQRSGTAMQRPGFTC